MKIGILTHWWGKDNYGQVLQMHGLYHYLSKQGYDVTIFRFNPYLIQGQKSFRINRLLNIFYPKKLWNYVRNKVSSLFNKKSSNTPSRGFDIFYNQYLHFSAKEYNSLKVLENDM